MTPLEINITIAELQCDLCQCCQLEIGIGVGHPIGWCACKEPAFPKNYYTDLNACREMERGNNNSVDGERYGKLLAEVIFGHKTCHKALTLNGWAVTRLACATAPQHCEAFLRFHGRWKQ